MIPDISLLQDDILLYNNIATWRNHQGRLSAHLKVFPSPIITWEFEVLGDDPYPSPLWNDQIPLSSIAGYQFTIQQPYPTGDDIQDFVTPSRSVKGMALESLFGSKDYLGNYFRFYLPNFRFESINPIGQETIRKSLKIGEKEIGGGRDGKYIKAKLDESWGVTLQTNEEALSWLDYRKSNIGTRITTLGYLHPNRDEKENHIDYPKMSLEEANNYIRILSVLLSFLNGSYIAPLLIEGQGNNDEKPGMNGIVFSQRITPLELSGLSWCIRESDLVAYLSCFQTLRKMLSTPPWEESFGLIISWYFQTIQPEIMNGGKMWQIIANSLGTALERLGYTILVIEENDLNRRRMMEDLFSTKKGVVKKYWNENKKSSSVKRIQLLLEKVGISIDRGYYDVEEVNEFINFRNEATHPIKKEINETSINHIIRTATQWIYEIILWRLGYSGEYLLHTASYRQSTHHRYDLTTRNPEW